MNIPVVAIVGRTNVGKSSLFNAIMGYRVAIVQDTPGVTRDRHMVMVSRYEVPFWLVDTGGVLGDEDPAMEPLVRSQAEVAIAEADIVICVLDGIHGPHSHDEEVVRLLRQSGKPTLWVINKTEKAQSKLEASEFYGLGIDDYFLVSAAHREGIGELVAAIKTHAKKLGAPDTSELPKDERVRIAIVGKPNVGKSTLINTLSGNKRLVVSPVAGTTRDAIDVEITREGKKFVLVDTAGLRRKTRVDDDSVERYSNLRTTKSIAGSDVVVLMLDATEGVPSDQEKKIATLAHEKGKGLILALNKWDAVEKDYKSVKVFENTIREAFKFAPYAPIIFLSALTGRRCPNLLDLVAQVAANRTMRIPTGKLNRLIERALFKNPPPVYRGHPLKAFFVTQISEAPPTIIVFTNYPRGITDPYVRFLRKCIREEFPLEGTDIRLIFKKKSEKSAKKDVDDGTVDVNDEIDIEEDEGETVQFHTDTGIELDEIDPEGEEFFEEI